MKAIFKKNDKKVIVKKGRFINFVKKGQWEYIERNNCKGAVIIIAMTDKNEVLFVEQYRPPVGKNVIEFPAGLIGDCPNSRKKTESFLTAAKRELLEETGYVAKKMKVIHKGPAASGISAEMLILVMASGLKKVSEGGGDSLESITVHQVPLNKADRWLKTIEKKGCLVGSRLYAGLYFLNKYNKKL